MKIYSYIVARDFGFAPNPFHGVCTLATCKPQIRKAAKDGDWIVGIGPAKNSHPLVYFMLVDEKLSFNQYWNDARFQTKKPNLRGSRMRAFGDNIYHQDPDTGVWNQENSHHSLPDGSRNAVNVRTDTSEPYVLVSRSFSYFGMSGPILPPHLHHSINGETLIPGRAHRCHFSQQFESEVIAWLNQIGYRGCDGEPRDWKKQHGA